MSDFELVQAFVSALSKVFTLGSYRVKFATGSQAGTRCLQAVVSWRGEHYTVRTSINPHMKTMLASIDWGVAKLRHNVIAAAWR